MWGDGGVALIELVDVEKVYRLGRVEVQALRGVSLTIEAGEFVSIMGPSGSGKSTLMNILGCLDRPTRGIYRLDGQDVSRLNEAALADIRNRRIGFVFQSFHLLKDLSARENVELPLVYRGVAAAERRRRALAALEAVGLAQRVHHRPHEMSGGEQQRVAIARALAAEPAVLLADEPTGNLDSRNSEEIMRIFASLNDRGLTIVQVTHEEEIARYSRRIIYVRDGRLAVPPRELAGVGAARSETQEAGEE